MNLYLDTCLIVAALVREAGTARIQDWLSSRSAGDLTVSDWVVTEFSSALSVKLRTGQIDPPHRAAALAQFQRLVGESFSVLPVSGLHFRTAARYADRENLNVRSGDALHLAICSDHGAKLCTLDRRLADAAIALGVSAELI